MKNVVITIHQNSFTAHWHQFHKSEVYWSYDHCPTKRYSLIWCFHTVMESSVWSTDPKSLQLGWDLVAVKAIACDLLHVLPHQTNQWILSQSAKPMSIEHATLFGLSFRHSSELCNHQHAKDKSLHRPTTNRILVISFFFYFSQFLNSFNHALWFDVSKPCPNLTFNQTNVSVATRREHESCREWGGPLNWSSTSHGLDFTSDIK